jgi:hypothetical protein
LGGSQDDQANSIVQTSDGGFAIAASAISLDGDVFGNHVGADSSNGDGWFVKLDSLGRIEEQKCLGGTDDDYLSSIIKTSDGGFVIAGSSRSDNGDVIGNHGGTGYDGWLLKLSSSYTIEWQECLGGTNGDHANSVIRTSDGGYALAGSTYSRDGDVLGIHAGGFSTDAWVVKLAQSAGVQSNGISPTGGLHLFSYPNPAVKNITLGFDLPKVSSPVITISGLTGSRIQEFQEQQMQQGHHEVYFDLGTYSTGTYFITIAASGLSETSRVEVVR